MPDQILHEQLAAALALPINGPASDGIGWYRTEEQRAACHAQATAVLTVVQPLLDAKDTEYEQMAAAATRVREQQHREFLEVGTELTQERDRYRSAWLSARQRAEAYGEGILRHVEDRDTWMGWEKQQAARAQAAEAVLGRLAAEVQGLEETAAGRAQDAQHWQERAKGAEAELSRLRGVLREHAALLPSALANAIASTKET